MELEQITEQNPWWENKNNINKDEKVQEALSKKHKLLYPLERNNTLLIGPRQVGKTTFLKLTLKKLVDSGISPKNLVYLSCEPIKKFNNIIEMVRFSDSLTHGHTYFFLDEITFVDQWQRAIKYILDSPLKQGKTFYITGSSSIALKKETFPGRDITTKTFLPLSFKRFCQVFASAPLKKEIKKSKIKTLNTKTVHHALKNLVFHYKEISRLFTMFTACGGFPRSMYEFVEDKKIKEQTYEIYWKWLIADIAKIERSERITSSVLLAILKNYTSRFSLNSVAKEMEIGSHVTVREYLEILEDLFVIKNIFPRKPQQKAELFRKMRKVYFIDPFLFAVFKKLLTKQSVAPSEVPNIIKGITAQYLAQKFNKVFYFSNKKEVDFLLENAGIEVKWQKKVSAKDFYPISVKNKILLSQKDFTFLPDKNLLIAPTSLFLLL